MNIQLCRQSVSHSHHAFDQGRANALDCSIQHSRREGFLAHVSMTSSEQGGRNSDTFLTGIHLVLIGSLSIFHSYCVECSRCMGKTIFSSSTEAYFNHAVITARRLVRVGLKTEPIHSGGTRVNGYSVRHSPPK